MKQRARAAHAVAAAAAALAMATAVLAEGPCVNDCGAGVVDEAEPCVLDDMEDMVNGGCNSAPSVFTELAASTTVCGVCSTYDFGGADRRDTDWYRFSQAALAAADADGDGFVELRATLASEFPGVTFVVDLDDPKCATTSVIGRFGFSSPGCGAPGDVDAYALVAVADHPNGVAVFASTGNSDGSGVFDGFECVTGQNDYTLAISLTDAADGTILIATGPDPNADGYLAVAPDPFGAWAHPTYGGGGDLYNPKGQQPLSTAFTNGLFIFGGGGRELLTLNENWQVTLGFELDQSMTRVLITPSVAFDDNADTVADRLESDFRVFGSGVDLTIHLRQTVEIESGTTALLTQEYTITDDSSDPLGTVEFVRAGDFDLLWSGDFGDDSVGTERAGVAGVCPWDCGDADGVIGIVDLLALLSQWGGPGSCDFDGGGVGIGDLLKLLASWGDCDLPVVSVFIQEAMDELTRIELSSDEADAYTGAKRGVDPDGAGGDPAYDFGTDTEVWDSGQLPGAWVNHIAGVGHDTNGESGPAPPGCVAPCDGHVYLRIPLRGVGTLGPGSGFAVRQRFGATSGSP